MLSDISSLHAPLRQPFGPEFLRNFHPANRVSMPDIRAVLLRTVRSASVHCVAFVAYRLTICE